MPIAVAWYKLLPMHCNEAVIFRFDGGISGISLANELMQAERKWRKAGFGVP